MEYVLLGWADDGPTLRLDWREFSYAGKFVMSSTGKAVAREGTDADGTVVGAAAFNEDRTDASTLWIRYVTVRADRRGEGVGARLCAFVRDRAFARGYDRVRIGVNNAFSFHALYKAGFCFTDEETGLAELVLEAPCDPDREDYQRGLDVFRERDVSDEEASFLAAKAHAGAPERVPVPDVQD